MAPIEPEGVFQLVEPFTGRLIAAVRQPSPCLQQDGWAEEAVSVPPVARASRGAAKAQNTLIIAVEPFTIFRRLQAFRSEERRVGKEGSSRRATYGWRDDI